MTLSVSLQRLLTDERLCQSEALYAFLSPSPEHLKVTRPPAPTTVDLGTMLLQGQSLDHYSLSLLSLP